MDLKPVSSITKLSAQTDYVLLRDIPFPTPTSVEQRSFPKDTVVRILSVIHGIIVRIPKSKIEFEVNLSDLAERPSPGATAEWHEKVDSSNSGHQVAAA